MGVDQYTSEHVFEPLPDGGRIVLQRKEPDSAGELAIREHMYTIAKAFAAGDFTLPGVVHAMKDVPGAAEMRELPIPDCAAAADAVQEEEGGHQPHCRIRA